MDALLQLAPDTPVPAPAPQPVGDPALARLNKLRLLALRCRSAARLDLFQACALLSTDRDIAANAYADALFRTLDQGLGRPPRIFVPGCRELSFDERWLMALIAATENGDEASRTFLLASRLRPEARRALAFLVKNLTDRLDTV